MSNKYAWKLIIIYVVHIHEGYINGGQADQAGGPNSSPL